MTGPKPWILVIDTATSSVVVAAGTPAGTPIAARSFGAEHRHGERLLVEVDRLIADAALERDDLEGVVVGTGPGAFTGLRVGLATAKTLAHELRLPIAGVPTAEALAAAATQETRRPSGREEPPADAAGRAGDDGDPGRIVVLLPAGPHDRVEIRPGSGPRLLPGGVEPELGPDETLVAVDLDDRAPADALEAGRGAVAGLAASLLRLGAERLARGGDDVARLVPEYVTLPRGVREAGAAAEPGGGIAWSRGPR